MYIKYSISLMIRGREGVEEKRRKRNCTVRDHEFVVVAKKKVLFDWPFGGALCEQKRIILSTTVN